MARHSTRPVSLPARDIPDPSELRADQLARRERIVDAAMQLMADTDFSRIQVKDVADAAGVALGTLYRYFSSKDHLMACALLKWSSGFEHNLRLAEDAPLVERVRTVYTRAARAFEKQPRIFDALTQLQATSDERAAAVFAEFSTERYRAFASALPDTPDVHGEDITAVMVAVLAESLRARQLGIITDADVHRRIERAAELLLRG